MADALACDGPGCTRVGRAPFLGWWSLESMSLVEDHDTDDRLDFCSWECLGAFVLDQAGDVAALEQRIADL